MPRRSSTTLVSDPCAGNSPYPLQGVLADVLDDAHGYHGDTAGSSVYRMRRPRLTHVLVLVLGVLYLVGGMAETIRVLSSGDGGLAFWFGTLVGGGALILLGEIAFRERPRLSFGLIAVGCIAGLLPTLWTILVPLFALTVLVLVGLRAGEAVEPRPDSPA
jgi:hypothetical protein